MSLVFASILLFVLFMQLINAAQSSSDDSPKKSTSPEARGEGRGSQRLNAQTAPLGDWAKTAAGRAALDFYSAETMPHPLPPDPMSSLRGGALDSAGWIHKGGLTYPALDEFGLLKDPFGHSAGRLDAFGNIHGIDSRRMIGRIEPPFGLIR